MKTVFICFYSLLLKDYLWFWLISLWEQWSTMAASCICTWGIDHLFQFGTSHGHAKWRAFLHVLRLLLTKFLPREIVGEFGKQPSSTLIHPWFLHEPWAYHHVITVSIEHLSAHKIQTSSCSMLQPGVLKRNMPNFSIFPAPFECIIFRTSSDESCAKRSSKLGWISLEASCITSWK